MSEEQTDFIDELEPLNIEARYPSYKERLMKSLTSDRCKELIEQTDKLRTWIKSKLSYSKGNHTEDSDIDIAVVVEHMSDDYFEDTPLLWKLKRKISNLIEPVLLTEDTNNPLYADILKTGILI